MEHLDGLGEMLPGTELEFVVEVEEEGERLDRWLAGRLGDSSSRSQLHGWLADGCVVRADSAREPPGEESQPVRKSHRVVAGERFRLRVPEPVVPDTTPTDLRLEVLFEDPELAVIVKPPGLSVHPGPVERRTTLINGILHRFGPLPEPPEDSGGGDGPRSPVRPGIVHRLDRDTEGLLIVARTERARRKLSEQFAAREVQKEYVCWVQGSPNQQKGTVHTGVKRHPRERTKMQTCPLGQGREAITHFLVQRVVHSTNGRTFCKLRIRIETGRTHQIRVQLASVGLPVVGDPLYSRSSGRFARFGLLLLACRLGFRHPESGQDLVFELPEPERFGQFEERCSSL